MSPARRPCRDHRPAISACMPAESIAEISLSPVSLRPTFLLSSLSLRLLPSLLGFLLLFARAALLGMHQPGYADAQGIQNQHGGSENAHVYYVRRGRNDGRNNEYHENRIAEVLDHELRAHDAHEGQEKYQDRHFENQSHAENDAQKELGVFGDRDHGLELPPETDQEV